MAANKIELKLIKPVLSEGAEIDTLTFREPIGEDIVRRGYPFDIYQGGGTDVDEKADEQKIRINTVILCGLASDLASVPKSTIKSLCVADFQNVISIVSGFFGLGEGANSDTEKK